MLEDCVCNLWCSGSLASVERQRFPVRAQSSASPQSKPAEYAGSETCKTCHEEVYKSWEKGPHWKQTLKEGGIAKHGCEDCHGAGAAHVADPADTSTLFLFGKASAKDINARCETCHASGTQHLKAINSLHRQADVSCISCHSSHHAEGREFLLAKPQPQLCVTCHQAQKAQFEMPFHHRVNEGLINCTDCHNPHGTVKPHQVRTSAQQDAVCFKCHADKQGPLRFRARSRQDGGLPVLPRPARRTKPSHAPFEHRQSALLPVPHELDIQCRTERSFLP